MAATSAYGRYCCKSPKLPGANFLAITRSDLKPPICVASISLGRSPVSLSSGDEAPHIFTRKSRLRRGKFLWHNALSNIECAGFMLEGRAGKPLAT